MSEARGVGGQFRTPAHLPDAAPESAPAIAPTARAAYAGSIGPLAAVDSRQAQFSTTDEALSARLAESAAEVATLAKLQDLLRAIQPLNPPRLQVEPIMQLCNRIGEIYPAEDRYPAALTELISAIKAIWDHDSHEDRDRADSSGIMLQLPFAVEWLLPADQYKGYIDTREMLVLARRKGLLYEARYSAGLVNLVSVFSQLSPPIEKRQDIDRAQTNEIECLFSELATLAPQSQIATLQALGQERFQWSPATADLVRRRLLDVMANEAYAPADRASVAEALIAGLGGIPRPEVDSESDAGFGADADVESDVRFRVEFDALHDSSKNQAPLIRIAMLSGLEHLAERISPESKKIIQSELAALKKD